jgi:DNA adenine methylase
MTMLEELVIGEPLRAPFPWFGGKRKVADLVWSRLGDVQTYNEPFAGSLAVLLGRPHAPRVETVNDLDCFLVNFWRAVQRDPDAVAFWCDAPINEADLHARHRWLVTRGRRLAARCLRDPHYFNVKIAGWWVWGQCLWIGSGWCQRPEWTGRANAGRRPRGIHAARVGEEPSEQAKRPKLYDHGGTGVLRRWQGGGESGGGSGVHAIGLHQQRPKLHGDGDDTGIARQQTEGLYVYMHELAARLRRVRVCCGDWSRVLTPSVTTYIGTCGVFLDPPYAHDLRERCYAEDHDISSDVRAWALANGDNPDFRIALCGYAGEHAMPDTWECVPWKAHGGYSRTARGVANRDRERIWFSPHCLRPTDGLYGLFGDEA